MIRFMCPGCKTVYEVDNSFAGQNVKCENCQTSFIVPPLLEEDCDHQAGISTSTNIPDKPETSNHSRTAPLQEKTNVKVEKKNHPVRKNKFIKYVSGMRMKYIFCAFLILFAVIVLVLMLKQTSSNESPGTSTTPNLRYLSTLPPQPKTEKYVEAKENKEQEKVNTSSTGIEQSKTEKYVEGKVTKERERVNSGNKRNTAKNGDMVPIEATTNDGRRVTLGADGTWSYSTTTPDKATASRSTTTSGNTTAPQNLTAIETVRAYLSTPSNRDRMAFVLNPEKVKPLEDAYWNELWAGHPREWFEILTDTDPAPTPAGGIVIKVNIRRVGQRLYDFYLKKTDNGYRIDWEITVGYNPTSIKMLQATKPTTPVRLRLLAKIDDYWNYNASQNARESYWSIMLNGADVDLGHGYVEKNTEIGQRISKILEDGNKHKMVLEVKFISSSSSSIYCLLITKIVTLDGWWYESSDSTGQETDQVKKEANATQEVKIADTQSNSGQRNASVESVEKDQAEKPILWETAIPCQYDFTAGFNKEGLALVQQNGKRGFIDKTGKFVIPCTFDLTSDFYEGVCYAMAGVYCGFIDKTGKFVIPCQFIGAGDFSEGLASVKQNDKYGFIDKTGQVVIPFQFDMVSRFHDGLSNVRQSGKWGFIDKTGKVVIPCQFDNPPPSFREGLAKVKQNGKDGFINKTGKFVIPCKFESAFSFSEGLACVKQNDKYGFIDKTGKFVIPCKFKSAFPFPLKGGLARVQQNDKYGFIDKSGKLIIPCKFEEAGDFSEGLASVKQNGEWGFIDKTGQIVVPYQFEEVSAFIQGFAAIKQNDKWGYIKIKTDSKNLGMRQNAEDAPETAEPRDAEAQFDLGMRYSKTKNYPEAVKWFRKAAEQGDAKAQFNLSVFLEEGIGVEKNEIEGQKWGQKAADQGYAEAQCGLGLNYTYGFGGIAPDKTEGAKWFRKAAEQGLATAQYYLGDCYAVGRGVQKNEVEAVKLYQKAAEQGNAGAQYKLGQCYFKGECVAKDRVEAVKWFRKAAEQGNAHGETSLGLCYASGNGVATDQTESAKWLRKAAEQGDADAQYFLGKCYAAGRGVQKNEVEAVKWLRKAAEQGDSRAQKLLKE